MSEVEVLLPMGRSLSVQASCRPHHLQTGSAQLAQEHHYPVTSALAFLSLTATFETISGA